MKQILRELLLVNILILTVQTVYAYDFEVDGIYYNKTSDSTCCVTYRYTYKTYSGSYDYKSGYSGKVVIPSKVTYSGVTYDVTEIGYRAFWYNEDITQLVIPSSVSVELERYSYYGNTYGCILYGCTNLKELIIFGETIRGATSDVTFRYLFWGSHPTNCKVIASQESLSKIGDSEIEKIPFFKTKCTSSLAALNIAVSDTLSGVTMSNFRLKEKGELLMPTGNVYEVTGLDFGTEYCFVAPIQYKEYTDSVVFHAKTVTPSVYIDANQTQTTATLKVKASWDESCKPSEVGLTSGELLDANNKIVLLGLTPKCTYYRTAYAIYNGVKVLGSECKFTTEGLWYDLKKVDIGPTTLRLKGS